MSNFLIKNQKTNIRFTDGEDIVLYEPTKEQYKHLKEKISSLSINQSTNTITIGEEIIRETFKTLVKDGEFIDEYDSEKLNELIENGNHIIRILFREIQNLLQEITDDIQYENNQTIKDMNKILNILTSNDDVQTMTNKFNKLLKKKKIPITFEEMSKLQNNPEEIMKLIQSKANNK